MTTDDRASDEPDAQQVITLRLYVAGLSPKSIRAIENLHQICDALPAGDYKIEVIDLLENPHLARIDGIIAVPTLVRTTPAPIQIVIGDLSDADQVISGLHLRQQFRLVP